MGQVARHSPQKSGTGLSQEFPGLLLNIPTSILTTWRLNSKSICSASAVIFLLKNAIRSPTFFAALRIVLCGWSKPGASTPDGNRASTLGRSNRQSQIRLISPTSRAISNQSIDNWPTPTGGCWHNFDLSMAAFPAWQSILVYTAIPFTAVCANCGEPGPFLKSLLYPKKQSRPKPWNYSGWKP